MIRKYFTNCGACKKYSWLVKQAVVDLPQGKTATLKDKLLCKSCITKAKTALETWKTGTPTPTQTS